MIEARNINTIAAELKTEDHNFVSGISKAFGGSEEGPNPHEYLEAALAACTITTLQMYANRKQLGVTGIHVDVKIESEAKEGTVINRSIKIDGDLSDSDRSRLLEIADKCPIHKLLSKKITILTDEK